MVVSSFLCHLISRNSISFLFLMIENNSLPLDWIFFIKMRTYYCCCYYYTEKRNITDERQALYDALQTLEDEISQAGGERGTDSFLSMSPTQPHMGDLTVYGVLRSLQGLPIHEQVMTDFPAVSSWYKKLQEVVEK